MLRYIKKEERSVDDVIGDDGDVLRHDGTEWAASDELQSALNAISSLFASVYFGIDAAYPADFRLRAEQLTSANPITWTGLTNNGSLLTGAAIGTTARGQKFLDLQSTNILKFSTPGTYDYAGGFTCFLILGKLQYTKAGDWKGLFEFSDVNTYAYGNVDRFLYLPSEPTFPINIAFQGDNDMASELYTGFQSNTIGKLHVIAIRSNGTTNEYYYKDDVMTPSVVANSARIATRPAFRYFSVNGTAAFGTNRSDRAHFGGMLMWNTRLSDERFKSLYNILIRYTL